MTPKQIKFVLGFEPDHNLGESECDIGEFDILIEALEKLILKDKPHS